MHEFIPRAIFASKHDAYIWPFTAFVDGFTIVKSPHWSIGLHLADRRAFGLKAHVFTFDRSPRLTESTRVYIRPIAASDRKHLCLHLADRRVGLKSTRVYIRSNAALNCTCLHLAARILGGFSHFMSCMFVVSLPMYLRPDFFCMLYKKWRKCFEYFDFRCRLLW